MAVPAHSGDGGDDKLPDITSLDPPAAPQRSESIHPQTPRRAAVASRGSTASMAVAALSGDGGDDKLPNTTSLDPPAAPQRNGEFPAPPSSGKDDDWDKSVMRMLELPGRRPRCGMKRNRIANQEACKKMFHDNREAPHHIASPANRRSDGGFSALPSRDGKPVLGLGLGMELPDPRSVGKKGPTPARATGCPAGEFCKKVMFRKLEGLGRLLSLANARNVASLPTTVPSPGNGKAVRGMELPDQQALCEMKQPPTVQTRDCPACERCKNVMIRKQGGLALPDQQTQCGMKRPPTAQTRGHCMCEACKKMMLDKQEVLRQEYEKLALEVAGFGATAGGGGLHKNLMLDEWEVLAMLARLKGVQDPNSSGADRAYGLHKKMILYEQGILLDSMEFRRLQEVLVVGSSMAERGLLCGSHGGFDYEAIHKLVKQTGESMQDIAETVIPQLFSKEILYEPVLHFVGRYPKWLEENKNKIKKEEYKQFQKQLELMLSLTFVYDEDPDNFSKIVKTMYKIGGCGRPPSEIIADMAPGLDPIVVAHLYPGTLELLRNVMGKVVSGHTDPSPK